MHTRATHMQRGGRYGIKKEAKEEENGEEDEGWKWNINHKQQIHRAV